MTGQPSRAKGCKWSDESKQKISGKNHPMYQKTYEEYYGEQKAKYLRERRRQHMSNRIVTQKTREKLSNRIITDEWRQKISNATKGRKMSDATKQKISESMSGNKNSRVDQTLYKFYHKDGRTIIARTFDMRKQFNCSTIHRVMKGLSTSSKGWTWKGEIISS